MKRSDRKADRPVETAEILRRRVEALEKKHGRDEAEANENIQRARPVTGEIDYEALSREHMARYPKIRAALAK